MDKIAIIDLGTNTFHLLIFDIKTKQVLTKFKYPVKIGEGGISKQIISEAAKERAIEALKFFKGIMNDYHCSEHHATATSAFRNAKNGQEFAEQISHELGIHIQIISGTKEAELIYDGIKQAVNIEHPSLIMDIGGGSVEFIICDSEKMHWTHSFEIGAQRLLDKFHASDPISEKEIQGLYDYSDKELKFLYDTCLHYKPKVLIGSSGTFDTIVEMHYHKMGKKIRPNEVSFPLNINVYYDAHKEFITKSRAERLEIPGMVEMRVDMIVVASCLIYHVLDKLGIHEIMVSSYALKEGLLSKLGLLK